MSDILNNILQQKLVAIQSSLPSYVKLNKESTINFDKILDGEVLKVEPSSFKYSGEYEDLINSAARKYNLSSTIIKAVIKAESGFNPDVVSKAGAMGLMQLMPGTAAGLGVDNPFDPKQNIDGGVRYLKNMLKEFDGNLEYALAAYNAGPGSVKKYGGIPPFDETQDYVKKIMSWVKNKV